ncbi:hypothetical protein TSO352_18765 [Azospirillum sp. TSO35-2]|nr:hypothetical protein TSO352_18765 [Azospirillum sp. TSO35-2]
MVRVVSVAPGSTGMLVRNWPWSSMTTRRPFTRTSAKLVLSATMLRSVMAPCACRRLGNAEGALDRSNMSAADGLTISWRRADARVCVRCSRCIRCTMTR